MSNYSMDLRRIQVLEKILMKYDKVSASYDFAPQEFVKEYLCAQKLFVDDEILIKSFLKLLSIKNHLESLLEAAKVPVENKTIIGLYVILSSSEVENVGKFLEHIIHCWDTVTLTQFMNIFDQNGNLFKEKFKLIAKHMCSNENLETFIGKTLERFHTIAENMNFNLINNENDHCLVQKKSWDKKFTLQERFETPPVPENTVASSQESCQNTHDLCTLFVFDENSQTVSRALNTLNKRLHSNTDMPSPSGYPTKPITKDSWAKSDTKRSQRTSTMVSSYTKPGRVKAGQVCESSSEQVSLSTAEQSINSIAPIKHNSASLLRNGARLHRRFNTANKLLIELSTGYQSTPQQYTDLLERLHFEARTLELQDVERKHLEGLMSHEDAKMAKLLLVEKKRAVADCVKHEKAILERQLQDHRRKEMIKLRCLVEKNADINELVKQAQMKCVEKKFKEAKRIKENLKEMKENLCRKSQAELERKINLIRCIKDIESCSKLSREDFLKTKFNKSESSGLGLFSEMSLAELENALENKREAILNLLKQKQEIIKQEKNRQSLIKTEAINTIQKFSNIPKKIPQKLQLQWTPKLKELKEKLITKRLQICHIKNQI